MKIHFDPLIEKKQAITYIDDTVMPSQNTGMRCSRSSMSTKHFLGKQVSRQPLKKKNIFFSKDSYIFWSRYIPRRNRTYYKMSEGLEKPQITRK